MSLRLVYNWIMGIGYSPEGLLICPCLSSEFSFAEAEFCYDGKRIRLRTENPADKRPEDGKFILRLNGRNRDCWKKDPLTGKEKAFLPREELLPENFIEVIF